MNNCEDWNKSLTEMAEAVSEIGISKIEVLAECTKCGRTQVEKLNNWFGRRYCSCPGKDKTMAIVGFRKC